MRRVEMREGKKYMYVDINACKRLSKDSDAELGSLSRDACRISVEEEYACAR